tara:strand:+ start:8411 stop:9478 length:1068 start_codon:yes stop_codon:yes gene_type:complete
MVDFFKTISHGTKNEYAALAVDGITAGDVGGFLDTGSYMFNALMSGSLYGGIANNKITAIAGEEATGKTFFVLSLIKHFLDTNEKGVALYFESESAISKKMIEERGIDSSRVWISPVTTIQEFRFELLKMLNNYEDMNEADRRPMIVALDSFGNLSTTKEIEDTAEGSETKDMTRAAVAKATFRVLTLKLGKLNVPLLVTNHVYDAMSLYGGKQMGGGSGLKYASSTTVFLSKAQLKDGTDFLGNIISCRLQKSRLTKERSIAKVELTYDRGLSRWYGMADIAVASGIWKKAGRIELQDGSKVWEKEIYRNPEKYFTEEVMNACEEQVGKMYLYGSSLETSVSTDVETDTETENE